ncbi:asparaginase [uncultured Roseobacter sp.]|uniref:asparaginase n=1 Tax=uncultured Roseobacter sp. TaxID=114847 RepID=UPI002619860D|nr:asparaginase [uncultured Roseobacter sp.]
MTQAAPMVEIWRGDFLESAHSGHAVVCNAAGEIVHSWGDPEAIVFPRSSSKMIQALPLITSGAADQAGLTTEHLALACASHNGAAIHTDRVGTWLDTLGLDDDALRCGPQLPDDSDARNQLIRAYQTPCQIHNNCSGKHTGFLTLAKHIGATGDYNDPDHAVQKACLEAFEETTGETSPGFGIDGCSAPNHAATLRGIARAMAHFAAAPAGSAAARLHEAMRLHPDLVAGEGRACTELMRAMNGQVAIKTGAEAFFTAILPEQKLGVALKIVDGATRASECAIAAILVKLGVLEPDHPATLKRLDAPITNRRDIQTGWIKATASLI